MIVNPDGSINLKQFSIMRDDKVTTFKIVGSISDGFKAIETIDLIKNIESGVITRIKRSELNKYNKMLINVNEKADEIHKPRSGNH